jgi:hypothetical protein
MSGTSAQEQQITGEHGNEPNTGHRNEQYTHHTEVKNYTDTAQKTHRHGTENTQTCTDTAQKIHRCGTECMQTQHRGYSDTSQKIHRYCTEKHRYATANT